MIRTPRRLLALVVTTLATVTALSAAPANAIEGGPEGALRPVGALDAPASGQFDATDGESASPSTVISYESSTHLFVVRYLTDGGPHLAVDQYDFATQQREKPTRTVDLGDEFPRWGGFARSGSPRFATGRGLRVIQGRDNPTQDDDLDVIPVRSFDDLVQGGRDTFVKGGVTQGGVKGIVRPFPDGAPAGAVGSQLLHLSRTAYAGEDGRSRQVSLTIDLSNDGNLVPTEGLGDGPVASGSVAQLVAPLEQGSEVLIDQAVDDPHALQATYVTTGPTGELVGTATRKILVRLPGQPGDRRTGFRLTSVSADGSGGAFVAGVSGGNVFTFRLVRDTATPALTWWTSNTPGDGSSVGEPRLEQLGNGATALLFEARQDGKPRLEYRMFDGVVVGGVDKATFPGVGFSSISPLTQRGRFLTWVGTDPTSGAQGWLYGLDVLSSSRPKLLDGTPLQPDRPSDPTIIGTPTVDVPLRSSLQDWDVQGMTFDVQWYADGVAIPGATAWSYTPTGDRARQRITITQTGRRAGYVTTTRTSRPTEPVNPGRVDPGKPFISGRTAVGSTLTAKHGTWSPSGVTFRYQWYLDGRRVSGATGTTFRLTSKHVGHRLSFHVRGSRPGYVSAVAESKQSAVVSR